MSYGSVYENKTSRSKGVALAITVHVGIIAAVMAMPGIEIPERLNGPFTAVSVPKPQPPELVVEDPQPKVKATRYHRQEIPEQPIIELPVAPVVPEQSFSELKLGSGIMDSGIEIPFAKIEIQPDPVIVGARLNARYAEQFQPAYPAGQLRLEREGEVSVRVLVGTDGRVKQIDLIDSPHQDFWVATCRQALQKWRFTPATSDGKPIESWMTLKVRFEINR